MNFHELFLFMKKSIKRFFKLVTFYETIKDPNNANEETNQINRRYLRAYRC